MSKCHIVGNLMHWLKYNLFLQVSEEIYLFEGLSSSNVRIENRNNRKNLYRRFI